MQEPRLGNVFFIFVIINLCAVFRVGVCVDMYKGQKQLYVIYMMRKG